MPKKDASDDALRCSFCNKSQREVKKLIAGPTVFICDECVDICLDIIAEDRMLEQQQETQMPKPMEIDDFLDQYVIDQDLAKKKLAVAVECFHKASLIHDDIEDHDERRYGDPTMHEVYGIPIALNAPTKAVEYRARVLSR